MNSPAEPAPKRRLTTTSYAILGLLSVRSWTTYELAKQVRRSLSWFWPRAERKLYDEPKRLVEAGLATGQETFTGRRRSTVYEITRAGRKDLADWLGQPSVPRSTESEAVLKVFFADAGDLDQLRGNLTAIAAESRERLSALAAMAAEPGRFPERRHLNALTIRFSLEHEEGTLRWLEWALQQVSQWTSTTDPGDWDAEAALDQLVDRVDRLDPRVR